MSERLQKYLARAGVASRRHAEEMISAGRVQVNNKTVTELGTKVEPGTDLVTLDGKLVSPPDQLSYYLLYKPPGVVTTLEDPQGRPTVGHYAKEVGKRVFPVGRLDYDAEGALLLTDDGSLAHQLLHPSFQVQRMYLAKVRGVPDEATLEKLRGGVRLEDGVATPKSVEIHEKADKNTWLRIVVAEGRPHLIKRLCAAVGHPVVRLYRPSQAGVSVEGLRPGEIRELTSDEVERVRAVASGEATSEEPATIRLPPRRHGREVPGFDGEEGEDAPADGRPERRPQSRPREATPGEPRKQWSRGGPREQPRVERKPWSREGSREQSRGEPRKSWSREGPREQSRGEPRKSWSREGPREQSRGERKPWSREGSREQSRGEPRKQWSREDSREQSRGEPRKSWSREGSREQSRGEPRKSWSREGSREQARGEPRKQWSREESREQARGEPRKPWSREGSREQSRGEPRKSWSREGPREQSRGESRKPWSGEGSRAPSRGEPRKSWSREGPREQSRGGPRGQWEGRPRGRPEGRPDQRTQRGGRGAGFSPGKGPGRGPGPGRPAGDRGRGPRRPGPGGPRGRGGR